MTKQYTVFDLETTIKTGQKRKATPFGGVNHVVASGWKRKGMAAAVGEYFGRSAPTGDWFTKLLDGTDFLVGFNIKFDILHAIQQPHNYVAWQDFVTNGGRVWDCQLAEYLIYGMAREHHMLSLDEVAPRYGGHLKDDAVKGLWQAGIDTTEIDKDLLMEYLVGAPGEERDLGDIGNTEQVFLGQVAALRARGGLQSALINMDAQLFIIEAEHNGMHIDKELGLKLAAELEVELAALRVELNTSLPELPFEFNWSSRFHLSALVFGGDVKYKAKAPILNDEGEFTYYQTKAKHYVLNDGGTTSTPPSPETVFDYATFASGKNKGEYKTKVVSTDDIDRGPKERYEDFYYHFKGYTTPLPQWKTSTDGVYSVGSEVIASLEGTGIPFLESLSKMSGLMKDLGTYFITTDENGEQKGMLTMVGSDGMIHHKINQTSTVTGRFSSSDPNLQNVSGSGKSKVKSIFTSRFKDGYIVQSDFTALEIYVQANLTLAQQLIEDLRKGLDMHIVRLSQKLGRPYEEVYAEYKAGDKAIAKGRKGSKEFSFQRAYGAGVAKIAKSTGMAEADVEALIAVESERYPEVDAFYIQLTETIQANRVPTNRFVQHPDEPGVQCQLGRSHYITPDKTMYSYSESPSPDFILRHKNPRVRTSQSFSPTEIKNYVVQGTGAQWMRAAMALSVKMWYSLKNFGGESLLVNTVHDAAYLDASPAVVKQSAALLQACMLEASAYIEYTFNWKIPVPVPCETVQGSSMIEELTPEDGWKDLVTPYRRLIRDKFMHGFKTSAELAELQSMQQRNSAGSEGSTSSQ